MVIDFKDLSALVKEHVLEVFDHSYLNDLVAFRPTAERLAMHILLILRRVSPLEILVKEVKLWETPTSFATATWC
jgi:6-pyruvoyltetrahydropterin/6-carboxytetrahydropterin synthase